MAECRSCHAPIVWATASATGKPMPVDREPSPVGNVMLMGLHRGGCEAIVLAGDKLAAARYGGHNLHLNHYVTCPDAAAWRDKSKAAADG